MKKKYRQQFPFNTNLLRNVITYFNHYFVVFSHCVSNRARNCALSLNGLQLDKKASTISNTLSLERKISLMREKLNLGHLETTGYIQSCLHLSMESNPKFSLNIGIGLYRNCRAARRAHNLAESTTTACEILVKQS